MKMVKSAVVGIAMTLVVIPEATLAENEASVSVRDAPASLAGDAKTPPDSPDAETLDVILLPAEQPAPLNRRHPEDNRVAEVIVTAQRREERAQDVPISITVFTPEQLTNANITNSGDLATYTPSLSVNTRFGNENTSFAIRGFTQDLRTTASVATYFAEVVAPRGQQSQTSGDGAGPGTLFDLANVQVLKGPQGTLFGRNTTGGAVLIVPRRPTEELGGYAELSTGNYNMRRAQAAFNLPLTDAVKLRFGIDHQARDGYLHNITGIGAGDLNDVNYTAGRLSMVWDLTDDLENYTILSYVHSETNGNTASLLACNPNPLPTSNPFFVFTGLPCQAQLARQRRNGNDGFYDIVSTIPTPVTEIKEKRLINTMTWHATDALTVKNIFAYAHLYTINGSDIFGTQFRFLADPSPVREFKVGISVMSPGQPVTSQETYIDELQLQGTSLGGDLQWQAGLYYEHSLPDGTSGNNSAGLISCELSTLEKDPSEFNCFDVTAGLLGSVLVNKFKTDYLNQAVYAQASYDITQQLSVTGGIRYTWDRTRGHGVKDRYAFALAIPLPMRRQISEPEVKSRAPTGVIEFSYKPVDDVMAYAKYSRGYRQGSVNLASDAGIDTFDPEHVNSYELGVKTSFGGPVPGRFNVAAFHNDLTNQQLQVGYVSPNAGPTTAIFNAGKSRISGAEVEAYFRLLRPLSLSVSYSYLDTELLEQQDHKREVAAAAGAIAGLAYAAIADVGDSLPFAPEHNVVTSLNYVLPLPSSIGAVELGATYVYTGKQRATATSSTPYAVLDDFSLLNLNLNWTGIFNLPLDFSLFGTNVLNERYVTYVSGTYNALGFDSQQLGMPRMFGGRLKYTFGGG